MSVVGGIGSGGPSSSGELGDRGWDDMRHPRGDGLDREDNGHWREDGQVGGEISSSFEHKNVSTYNGKLWKIVSVMV